jgi:TRAP-type mannitol/chloroaromatic compound transport system substrate-binding protein
MTRSVAAGARRTALKAGLAGAALAAPALASAQTTFNWKMTSAYGKGSPFYMDGPGSATDLARRIREMLALVFFYPQIALWLPKAIG